MSKKIISILLAITVVVTCFVGCSKKSNQTSATTQTTQQITTKKDTDIKIEAKDEVISFTQKDESGNILTLVPIFDKDAKTIIAGYLTTVKDKNNKILTAKQYKLLNSVVSVSMVKNKPSLDKDSKKQLISVKTYADKDGNIIAINDIKDINKNKNKTEFLKVSSKKDTNSIIHYMLDSDKNGYIVYNIQKTSDGKTEVTDKNGNKVVVEEVNSNNTSTKNKIDKDKKSNTNVTTTKNKNNSPSTTKSNNNNKPSSDNKEPVVEKEIAITLNKNSKATCSSKNVEIATGLVKIKDEGDYVIKQDTNIWHGEIDIQLKNTKSANIRFENVNIENTSKNIIKIIDTSIETDRSFIEAEATAGSLADDSIEYIADQDEAPDVSLSFPSGTTSTFSSSGNGYTGVIYNESKLTLKGNGNAYVNATRNINNSICSTKSITIKNVNLNLSTAANDMPKKISEAGSAKGIFSYSKVTVESGKLNVKSNGDAVRCDRFIVENGVSNLNSAACDGIDANDSIEINGGITKVYALQKTSYKVRRVNNTNNNKPSGIRDGKGDTFKITGGEVIGESQKVTRLRPDTTQPSIICQVKKTKNMTDPNAKDTRVPVVTEITNLSKSSNACASYLYSTNEVKKDFLYTIKAKTKATKMIQQNWSGAVANVEFDS